MVNFPFKFPSIHSFILRYFQPIVLFFISCELVYKTMLPVTPRTLVTKRSRNFQCQRRAIIFCPQRGVNSAFRWDELSGGKVRASIVLFYVGHNPSSASLSVLSKRENQGKRRNERDKSSRTLPQKSSLVRFYDPILAGASTP